MSNDAGESLEGIQDSAEFTSHVAAFDEAVRTAPRLPRDAATVHLARHYAAMLDDAFDRLQDGAEQDGEDSRDFARVVNIVAKIGPRYEAVLDKLGMSPGARPAARGGDPHGSSPASQTLRELQSGAAAHGVDPAAGVDPAVAEALAGE